MSKIILLFLIFFSIFVTVHGRPCTGRAIANLRCSSESLSSSVAMDMAALLAFKANTSGGDLLLDWGTNLSSPCGWEGVQCSDGLRVSSLNLPSRNLSGFISPHLAFLHHLTYLNLSANNFSGGIPAELALLVPTLTHLDFRQNSLNSHIPNELGLCKDLLYLDLSYNPIHGSIPTSFGHLTSLQTLHLHNMPNLTGGIPPELGNLENLVEMHLFNNSLTGPIPPELGHLRNLQLLFISKNEFSGGIPPELGQLSSLTHFDASSCNLSGPLPPHLGNLTNLQILSLDSNHLTAGIPAEFGRLESLRELNLFSNNLSGALLPQLGQLKKLESIYLFSNKLSGPIPPEFGQMESLKVLCIYSNNLSGSPLPTQLRALQNLTDFIIFGNQFTGPIPPELGQMKNLINVSLGHNFLTGGIPPEIGLLKNMQSLEITNSSLTGEIPSTLANLTDLRFLDVSYNSITGEVPDFLLNFTRLELIKMSDNHLSGNVGSKLSSLNKLRFIFLANNALTGSITASFANLSSLIALDLSRNQFTGSLPHSLGLCKNLRLFFVGHNNLGGPLPSWLWGLGQLQVLDLSENDFTGSIPNSLEKLHGLQVLKSQTCDLNMAEVSSNSQGRKREYYTGSISFSLNKGRVLHLPEGQIHWDLLTILNLRGNRIGGNLPETLSLLNALAFLDLSRNLFMGSIPGSISNMSALRFLDLSQNKLTGEIPFSFAKLASLYFVNLSSNNLSGQIPQLGYAPIYDARGYLDNPSLCGPPLDKSCLGFFSGTETRPDRGLSMNLKARIGVACSVSIIILAVITLLWLRRIAHLRYVHTELPYRYKLNVTEHDLLIATDGFNDRNIIGKGGFSTVYKAVLSNGSVVAVKKLHTLNQEVAWRSLIAECQTLGKIVHRNLVKILCTCVTPNIRAIVLEYMPNGSLHAILYETQVCSLSWEARVNIAQGIADGLKYLHCDDSGFGQVWHLDLKPGNILLDKYFEPKIGDFGISRLVNPANDRKILASECGGSIGYMAPEMGCNDLATSKADVYSYGIIILELITRKKPTDTPLDWTNYPDWIHSFLPDKILEVIDPQLLHDGDTATTEEVYREILSLLKLGLECAQVNPRNRPTMKDILNTMLSLFCYDRTLRRRRISMVSFSESSRNDEEGEGNSMLV